VVHCVEESVGCPTRREQPYASPRVRRRDGGEYGADRDPRDFALAPDTIDSSPRVQGGVDRRGTHETDRVQRDPMMRSAAAHGSVGDQCTSGTECQPSW